eukprot:TRINITY_DN108_c3_g1_i4.p1 TRINITY_DN108_c3_g1~~TRINITY_DN108_c3_g1_i4.p1  ORF type:complete len:290 (-),score=39.99 TRINITY_DN108_c3_g1_i4:42-911(-)
MSCLVKRVPLPSKRRGIAGTALVVKLACAKAAEGGSLPDVTEIATSASSSVKTMGVAISNCNLPNTVTKNRIPSDCMELGLGIHGEPGKEILPLESTSVLTNRLVKRIVDYCDWSNTKSVILMVNNLGTITPTELTLIIGDTLKAAHTHGLTVVRHSGGTYVSSLDMHGFSISILPVCTDPYCYVQLLDQPTAARGWTPFTATGDYLNTAPIKIPPSRDTQRVNMFLFPCFDASFPPAASSSSRTSSSSCLIFLSSCSLSACSFFYCLLSRCAICSFPPLQFVSKMLFS